MILPTDLELELVEDLVVLALGLVLVLAYHEDGLAHEMALDLESPEAMDVALGLVLVGSEFQVLETGQELASLVLEMGSGVASRLVSPVSDLERPVSAVLETAQEKPVSRLASLVWDLELPVSAVLETGKELASPVSDSAHLVSAASETGLEAAAFLVSDLARLVWAVSETEQELAPRLVSPVSDCPGSVPANQVGTSPLDR